MTRNRALRAIEELVHAKERAVLFAAGEWFEYTPDDDKAMTLKYRLADTVHELKDALALLAQATEGPTAKAPHSPLRALS